MGAAAGLLEHGFGGRQLGPEPFHLGAGRGARLADLERFLLHIEPVGEQLSGKAGALVEGREA